MPALFGFHSFPSDNDESLIRGIIILGSAASVYENLPWQRPFEAWLKPQCERGIPVLGLCYGHQMLAHMFGGKIAYMSEDQQKLKGIRMVEFSANALQLSGSHPLVVTHNEAVTELPDCMEVWATSSAVKIDGLKHKKWPVFGLQSHPEATIDFLRAHGMLEAQVIEALPSGHAVIKKFFDITF